MPIKVGETRKYFSHWMNGLMDRWIGGWMDYWVDRPFINPKIHLSIHPAGLGGEEFAAGVAEFFHAGRGFRLDVTTDERFGAAGAKRHPFVIRQEEFVTVRGDEFFHLKRPDVIQPGAKFGEQRFFFVGRDGNIDAVAVKFAGLFFQIF